MSGSRLVKVLVPILFAVLLAVAYTVLDRMTGTPGESGPTTPGATGDVAARLGQLKVAPEGSMSGYSREKFPHWDSNEPEHGFGPDFAKYEKCTTREVMLLRDATGPVQLDPKTCEFTLGRDGGWRDRYGVLDAKTGTLEPYDWTTDSSKVDAEHIVALAEAWRSGAAALDTDTRRRIANDAINLNASDPSANRSKGDQDAAGYLPPGEFRCAYVARYIEIKVKYALTVDSAEQGALRTAVDDCVRGGGFG